MTSRRRFNRNLALTGAAVAVRPLRSLAQSPPSDRVVVVITQDVPSVRNAQRCLELFRELGYPERQVHLILNRF